MQLFLDLLPDARHLDALILHVQKCSLDAVSDDYSLKISYPVTCSWTVWSALGNLFWDSFLPQSACILVTAAVHDHQQRHR